MIHIEHRGFVFSALLAYAITLTACGTESGVGEGGSGANVNAERAATISQALEVGPRFSVSAQTLEESDSARLKTDPTNMRPHALPPWFGPTIPTITSVTPNVTTEGVATSICLDGQSMINTVVEQNKTYSPMVVVSLLDDNRAEVPVRVITPTSVTQSQVCFTATLPAGVFNLRVFKDYQGSLQVGSNDLSFVVRPKFTIDLATVCNGMVRATFTDPCRSANPPSWCNMVHYLPCIGPGCWMWVGSQFCERINWGNQEIVATCPNATGGAQVIIGGPSGLFLRAKLVDGCK
jgi:predicted small secreted protein